MLIFNLIAEQKITEAIARGELAKLHLLRLRLETRGPRHFGVRAGEIYYQRVLDRFR